MTGPKVVVIGAGHAGVQVGASLREEGFDGDILLLSEEAEAPYHRPPLSKTVLQSPDSTPRRLRSEAFFDRKDIRLQLGTRATSIDVAARAVVTCTGITLPFDHLVLALGSMNRSLRVPGIDAAGVYHLRSLEDAGRIQARLTPKTRLVIVGAGFIGLEVAAALKDAVGDVTVIEAADRVLARSCSELTSSYLLERHRGNGIEILTSTAVEHVEADSSGVTAVVDTNGVRHEATALLVAVGAVANTTLARASGLTEAPPPHSGIEVDSSLRTSAPGVYAIGDCANFPFRNASLRLESVQNAVDQGRYVAAHITGSAAGAYDRVPWFWSDQGKERLQIAGLSHSATEWVVRGDTASGGFSVFGYAGRSLTCVESINRPGDHVIARKLLELGADVRPEQAADPKLDLGELLSVRTGD